MKLIDANACFGLSLVNHENVNHENFIMLDSVAEAATADELIGYMDHSGIEKAVVWHKMMYDYDAPEGNAVLMDAIEPYKDRLIPSWTILPSVTDVDFSPDLLADRMKKANVRFLRIFPQRYRFLLNEVTMGEQLAMFCELKIPVYLETKYGFEDIYAILKDFPELTVILCNIGIFPSARYVDPLLKRYKNVYFETGDFTMLRGYEHLCERFGSERAIFSTNFPSNAMGASIAALMLSGISEEEKENIAFRNLDRLEKEVAL